MIKFDQVTLSLGKNPILQPITLEIKSGDFVTLIGPSGAGKSSFLKLLTGEYKPTSGILTVDDVNLASLNPKFLQLYRRKIGVIHQDFKLLPKKTVWENIAFALEVCEAPDSEVTEIVPEVLDIVGLHGKENSFPAELSGGEQQRVAIARALAHRPALLIADEPTGNLDKANSLEVFDVLKKINQQGVTVIMTTHQPNLLKTGKSLKRLSIANGIVS